MQQLKSEECKIRPQRSDNASNPRNVLNSSTETCTYTGKKNLSSPRRTLHHLDKFGNNILPNALKCLEYTLEINAW